MITAVGTVVIVAVLGAGIAALVGQEMHAAKQTRNFLKARVIAEAGANARYNSIRTNFTGFGESPEVAFGGGTYQTTLTAVGEDRAHLLSIGRCGDVEARVDLSLRNFQRTHTTEGQETQPIILQNGITTAGQLTLNGLIQIYGGIASSTGITLKGGGNGTVEGDANAPTITGTASKLSEIITGTLGDDAERYTVDWNSFLKLEDYTSHAVTWDGVTPLSSYPAGTIVYYDGDIDIQDSPVNCCIIATGDISVQSHVTLNKPGTYPTLISRDGSITVHGGPTINGLIVAMSGTVNKAGGGGGADCNIYGAVVTQGALDFGGGFVLNHDDDLVIIPPDTTVVYDNTVVIAWQ